MKANPNESWIGLWETNQRACPFRCTFCDWGSATAAKVTKFGDERLFAEVDWFAEKKIEYIFCCDANFGIQKRDVDDRQPRGQDQEGDRPWPWSPCPGAEYQERDRACLPYARRSCPTPA